MGVSPESGEFVIPANAGIQKEPRTGHRLSPVRRANRKLSGGFTLLETLVALAIVGIAMAAAMRSTHFAVDTVAELRARTAGAWVAQNVVNELLAARVFPEVGTSGGRAVQGAHEFLWRQEVRLTPNYSFRRVEVTVFQVERPEHAVARQMSYVARLQD